ncbi:STAS domain-containing protein [Actinoplanes awajinensis]|uniref:STAS domain-containing protein n=1 Tax=Actinoplanes awajinensis subsp. mycoplanecinus TaxID=135947 RepID=A0A124GAC2_9ACTN|nr:STAS domain-containing protein [Actinoplanes awajinensis]KUL31765.1 hypothetical protein ADL15_21575 [Actinoplanes awajinensis subsp. mycoplanecinus]
MSDAGPRLALVATPAAAEAGTVAVTVIGDLDATTMAAFDHQLAAILDSHPHHRHLDLDLSAVDFCDLTGLRTLQTFDPDGAGQRHHPTARITGAGTAVQVLLRLCRIPTLLGYHPPTEPRGR